MRERYDQAGRFDTTNTLERLQQALTALERRVDDTVQAPRRNPRERDIASIRARQGSLDQARHTPRRAGESDSRSEGLRREIERLRDDVGREIRASSGGFEALRDEIRSMRAATGDVDALRSEVRALRTEPADMSGLRGEIDQLKSEVTALAREDTVRELTERWSGIEREIARLPQSLASYSDVAGMAGRIDDMQRELGQLPRAVQLDTLEEQLRALAGAVEQVARHNTHGTPQALEDLDVRLDEISRAIAAIAPGDAHGFDKSALERVEARIASLATQIDQLAQVQVPVDYGDRFTELLDRIEGLRIGIAPGTVSGEAMDALNDRVDTIAEAIADLVRQDGLSGEHSNLAVAELEERLSAIDAQLQQAGVQAEQSAEQVVRSVDDRMAEIARRIDQNQMAQAAVPSIGQLEHRLDEIAAMLASGAGGQMPVDLASLETQIADLSASLSPDRAMPVDEETIWTAARTAAEEVAARVASTGETQMPEAISRLTEDLRVLETLARDSDGRNAKTFEAIHDTLLQVVDHLANLEERFAHAPAGISGNTAAQSAPESFDGLTPIAPDGPAELPGTAPIAASLADQGIGAPTQRGAVSPAEAAAEAAMFALGEGQDGHELAPSAEPASGPRGLLKSVAERLPIGRTRGGETETAETEAAAPADGSLPVVDDHPIEPVSEDIALADIMARVRAERTTGSAPPTEAGNSATATEAGKSDFIAAARRAAQAAAADASIMANGRSTESTGMASSIGALMAGRRRPIFLAAGAILLAILAIPLVRGFLAPAPQNLAADATPVPTPAITETLTEAAPEATEQAASTPLADADSQTEAEGEIVRDVLADAGPTAPVVADETTPEILEEVDAEPVLEASAPEVVEAPETVIPDPAPELAEVQTASFEGIPDDIGPTALREAAADGDAKALHLIGDRVAMSAGGDEQALAQAFGWYEQSAELGFAPAQYRLGNFYEKGIGTERDFDAAKTWYQLAAEQGNASAMHNLAVLFASGSDGAPDFESAARWFLRAAELGVRDSQFNLGILSAKGQGVPQDLNESYKWFALAAQSGDQDAASKRDDVADVLRPDQLEQAQGATALWKAKPADPEVNVVDVPEAWQTDEQRTAAATPPISGEDMKRAVANIQAILNDQGYDAGPVDGIMGQKTRDAIIAFQRDNGIAATGNVDQVLVEKLLAIANGQG